jgi:hypothetical protein
MPIYTTFGPVYEAAERRDFRGYLWVPDLAPKELQDAWTRRVIVERSVWLYANVGALGMVIDGLALDEVGTGLWPKWTTGEERFDRAMTDHFHFTCHEPFVFSSDGNHDVYSVQVAIRRMVRLYGDCFGQLLRPAEGSVMPQFHLLPGYRVDNFGDEKPESGWRDGVRCNRLGRAIEYKVLSEDGRSFEVVPAEDLLHFHAPFLPGQLRGMPAVAAVAKRLFRREDILKAIANGTLARERMGFAIEQAPENPRGRPMITISSNGVVSEAPAPDGESTYTLASFFGKSASEEVEVPSMPPGVTIRTLESNRPGAPLNELDDRILREFAWATGYPVEYVFFIAGGILGTFTRLVLQKVKANINAAREFQLKPQFLKRWCVYFAWQRIKLGYFDELAIPVPKEWWKHKLHVPADMTVDLGREGQLYDRRVATGKMSLDEYHSLGGADTADVDDANLARWEERMKKLEAMNARMGTSLSYFDVWPRTESAPAPGTSPATGAEGEGEGGGDNSEMEAVKILMDSYGVAVRAGAITPSMSDEEAFRTLAKLPALSDAVRKAWEEDGFVRRPITLVQTGGGKPAPPGAGQQRNEEDEE